MSIMMGLHIYRSVQEPIRNRLSWKERWEGPDKGLIICWEVGRKLAKEEPELVEKVKRGELPVLGWKGGVEKSNKKREKYGTLHYLAKWHGLRGDDLDIDLNNEYELICSSTGMKVIFTSNVNKW